MNICFKQLKEAVLYLIDWCCYYEVELQVELQPHMVNQILHVPQENIRD